MIQTEETTRRSEERSNRQSNMMGQTTMISPLARVMTQSIRKTSDEAKAKAKVFVDAILNKEGELTVFSKTTCPRCSDAITLLRTAASPDLQIQVIQLDIEFPNEDANFIQEDHCTSMAAVQDELWERTGCRTVPRIFQHNTCLGGHPFANHASLISTFLTFGYSRDWTRLA